MKNILILFCFSLSAIFSSELIMAQTKNNPSGVYQIVDISKYPNLPFTLTCWSYGAFDGAYEIIPIALEFTSDGRQIGTIYGSTDNYKQKNWNLISLSGKIKKGTQKLAIGALYNGKGKFIFDDFNLYINEKGKQIPIQIINSDFENGNDIDDWKFSNTPKGTVLNITNEIVHSGKNALDIDTRNTKGFAHEYIYGHNDSVGKYVGINGVNIYYETYGAGEPLLLLHGNEVSIESFHAQIPELSKYFKVIAMDTRGQGNSSYDSTLLTYELFADDTYKLLNKLNLDSVNVLGWSDGGNTGLILAMKHPEKVKKLAIMGANLFNNSTSVYAWVNDTVRNRIKRYNAQKNLSKNDSFVLRLKHLLLTQPNLSPESLHSIQCPVLVMAGQHDVIKEAHTKLIADNIKISTLIIFKGATHEAPWEIPDMFNKTAIDFFEKK